MFTLELKQKKIVFNKPVVMGILNITPDSFFDQSRINNDKKLLSTVEKMLNDGATFIDIGGQSTRPQSVLLSADEELKRVMPAIEIIINHFPEIFISIDTFYGKVAHNAVEAGACLINDISAASMDNTMLHTVAALQVPYVCMHMKGTPQTMQQQTNYNNVVAEVKNFFSDKINELQQHNIHQIIVDIGFGFAKTTEQNFELLNHLLQFKTFEKPLMVGVSRKSSIYKTLNITANEALNGTTVLNTIALLKGANILRVHDVKEAVECVKLCEGF